MAESTVFPSQRLRIWPQYSLVPKSAYLIAVGEWSYHKTVQAILSKINKNVEVDMCMCVEIEREREGVGKGGGEGMDLN
jgi:hypothetical protein